MTEVADRITVLRRGKKIETIPAEGATEQSLARLMVGREVLLRVDKSPSNPTDVLLDVEDLHVFDDRGIEKVRGLSLGVRAGEIVGLAGIDGNGQTELIDAMTGLRKVASGRVSVAGEDVTGDSAYGHFKSGLGHIPEDRQRRGLVLEFSIAENIALHDFRQAPDSKAGWLFPNRLIARATQLIKDFDVRGGNAQSRAGGLSGGNQQKVVLAREIDRDPKVLIAAQPTRGLDVGAIEFVHRRLVEERDEGRGILLVSLELEEILSLSDRILVMYEGEIVGEYPPTTSEEAARHRDDRRRPRTRGGGVSDHERGERARASARASSRGGAVDPSGMGPEVKQSLLGRYDVAQKAGGLLAPVLTALLAFFVGGLVVLVTTGSNPITTYRAIFDGAGFNWFFPWVTGLERSNAAENLQQTLILTTTLILTGLAVAFAFRCGLFNIGGQGQYIVGAVLAVWIGSSFSGMNSLLHILFAAIAGAALRRALGRYRGLPQSDCRAPTRSSRRSC